MLFLRLGICFLEYFGGVGHIDGCDLEVECSCKDFEGCKAFGEVGLCCFFGLRLVAWLGKSVVDVDFRSDMCYIVVLQ